MEDDLLVQFLVEQAYLNSYNVIVNGVLPEEIMDDSDTPMFAHSVMEGANVGDIDRLVKHFEVIEDYEKCSELMVVRDNIDGFPTANHLGSKI